MRTTGRRSQNVYPDGLAAAAAAAIALRNRNVAGSNTLVTPFTPSNSLIAACLFTPKVSGVIQVSGALLLQNGAVADTYTSIMEVIPGTGLSVSGGAVTDNGWVIGSTVPPVVGGVTGVPVLAIESLTALAGNAPGSLSAFGIGSSPQPLGVPVVITFLLAQVGGGHSLAQLDFTNLSVLELP